MAGKLRSNFTWDFCMQGTQMFKWLNTYGKVVLHVNYFDSNKLSHLLVIMTNVLTSEYSVFFFEQAFNRAVMPQCTSHAPWK